MRDIYLLSKGEYSSVKTIEVFEIKYFKNNIINLNNYDALIFTSKNAIYAIDSINKNWKNIPSYVIAKKTADVVKKLGGKLAFTGLKSHGNEFAEELFSALKNKKALYLSGEKTVSNLQNILKENNINISKEVCYKTICKNNLDIDIKNNAIIIFTSPSSIECFLKNYSWNSTFIAIAIGNTTAKYLPKNIEYKISNEQTIEACVKLAQTIAQN